MRIEQYAEPQNVQECVEKILCLMDRSAIHRYWTVSDVSRLIFPPIRLKQAVFVFEKDECVGFCTWGFFSKAVAEGFVSRTRPLEPPDWTSGSDLWIVDMIAPYGHGARFSRWLVSYFSWRFPDIDHAGVVRYYAAKRRRVTLLRRRSTDLMANTVGGIQR